MYHSAPTLIFKMPKSSTKTIIGHYHGNFTCACGYKSRKYDTKKALMLCVRLHRKNCPNDNRIKKLEVVKEEHSVESGKRKVIDRTETKNMNFFNQISNTGVGSIASSVLLPPSTK